ncbi:MAG: 2-C-methyl-D-erythritol 2,4-cyclodiphosphate synthase [Nitrospirae bacterium]|nr:2-C-methyl-D-erythritol 2,4-cyclodiphosphate synthase [Nitrospirota bacterium]
MNIRIGSGYDSHRLVHGRKLIIGGVEIPYELGLEGHSDADVLTHAIVDAIIGASGMGDIGRHFSDKDVRWKGADSQEILRITIDMITKQGFKISWIDCTVIAERPRLSMYIDDMKKALTLSGIPVGMINIKAKTNEGMGFIGRGEGIASMASCLLIF